MKRIWSAFRSAALLLLLVAATGCSEKSSPLVDRSELTVNSGESVRVIAIEGADEYLWRGVDDTEGISFNTEGRVLEFTAPVVQKRHTALFELEAKFRFFTQKQNVKVVIEPVEDENTYGSDGNLTAPATDGGGDISRENNASTKDEVSRISLTLHIIQTLLNKDHNTSVNVTALYDDNGSEDVTHRIEWRVEPKGTVSIKSNTLTALKDGSATIQAKVGNTLSNTVKLNIYWEVDGHKLPPEPDPKVNNATLLGVDLNCNGVRDDVERWIYKTYSHPIERALLMQDARYEQSILKNYSAIIDRDNKILKELNVIEDNYLSCMFYWKRKHSNENFQLSLYSELEGFQHKYFSEPIKKIQRNTIERINARNELEKAVSGGVYSLPEPDKSKCDFNATELMKYYQ